MNPNEPWDDEALRTLMESLPMSPNTPENLKSKLVDLAASPAAKHRAVRRPIFALAMSAATIVAAVAVMTSHTATAKTWEGVKKAAEGVRKMELVVTDPDSNQVRSRTKVAQGAIEVHLSSGDWMYVTDRLVRTYDKSDNEVIDVTIPEKGPSMRESVMKELSMATILAQYEEKYGSRYAKIGPTHDRGGRQVYDVTLREPNSVGYGNLIVDAATDLPVYLEAFEPKAGKPVRSLEMAARFNQEAGSPSDPGVPAGARHQTMTAAELMAKNGGKMPKLNFSFRRLLAG